MTMTVALMLLFKTIIMWSFCHCHFSVLVGIYVWLLKFLIPILTWIFLKTGQPDLCNHSSISRKGKTFSTTKPIPDWTRQPSRLPVTSSPSTIVTFSSNLIRHRTISNNEKTSLNSKSASLSKKDCTSPLMVDVSAAHLTRSCDPSRIFLNHPSGCMHTFPHGILAKIR